MTRERLGHTYGGGRILGSQGMDFLNMPIEEQALALGWEDGCPIAPELIQKNGAEKMRNRYGEINHWFGTVADKLKERNLLAIYDQLTQPQPREENQLLGMHDSAWTPKELETHMFGPGNPYGYAIPRMIIKFLQGAENTIVYSDARQERFSWALNVIDDVIHECAIHPEYKLTEFTVLLASKLTKEGVVKYSMHPGEFFHQLIGTGKLNEDNCKLEYRTIVDTMYRLDRDLYNDYFNLGLNEAEQYQVAIYNKDY